MTWRARSAAWMLAAAIVLSSAAAAQPPEQRSTRRHNEAQNAVAEFSARVNQYLDLRKQKAGTSPGPTKSARKLTETREQLRARIQAARPNAQQGNIFVPAVAPYFRGQIAQAFRGPAGARVLASLRRAEPVKIKVGVNQPYPDAIPLQSMPPSLLMKLPTLPRELEYRIVNRDLILRDTAPNLVVDILPDAIPAS